jgi:hypothetical protein
VFLSYRDQNNRQQLQQLIALMTSILWVGLVAIRDALLAGQRRTERAEASWKSSFPATSRPFAASVKPEAVAAAWGRMRLSA